jgi:hypothetical protein
MHIDASSDALSSANQCTAKPYFFATSDGAGDAHSQEDDGPAASRHQVVARPA